MKRERERERERERDTSHCFMNLVVEGRAYLTNVGRSK